MIFLVLLGIAGLLIEAGFPLWLIIALNALVQLSMLYFRSKSSNLIADPAAKRETGNFKAQLVEISNLVQQELKSISAGVNEINGEIQHTSVTLTELDKTGKNLQQASSQISQAITAIHLGIAAVEHKGQTAAKQAIELSVETECIFRELSQISRCSFFSEVLQEAILQRLPDVLYAGAVDRNGYFPTHNQKFSQPLTGNYPQDLLQNRTKRIFNDRTGSRCGSNTQAMLLQTYKRDTGEVLHDLSVPILVNGRHFGGFRIGFSRPKRPR